MDYDDDIEILWLEEGQTIPDTRTGFYMLANANMVIRLKPSVGQFDIVKNRFGPIKNDIPLDLLDSFLEHPNSIVMEDRIIFRK